MILDSFALHYRTALVTGANTGLGQAIAIALAQSGADIVCLGRSEPTDTAAALGKLGRRCHWVQADLAGSESAETMLQAAVAAGGPLHILVNNAGTIRRNDALDFSEADWDEVMEVNLKRAFFLSQAFARHLRADQRGGKIINIASMLSFQGGIRVASYTASKSGLLGLTRLLANEWAAHGIHVNAIAPGYFATNNTQALQADPVRNRDILTRIPAGAWGQPSQLGGAAVYLASAASDYVHGSVLAVDGGWLAR